MRSTPNRANFGSCLLLSRIGQDRRDILKRQHRVGINDLGRRMTGLDEMHDQIHRYPSSAYDWLAGEDCCRIYDDALRIMCLLGRISLTC